jgi:hypothetical protein
MSENVGALTSRKPKGLHGLYRESFTFYSEIAPSRKQFGTGHMYINNILLRMTHTMTSQKTELSSWDILYI